jgi:hypothetical protein
MPVNFSLDAIPELVSRASSTRLDACCDNGCERVKATVYVCQRVCDPNNPYKPTALSVSCTDPTGNCKKTVQHYDSCYWEQGDIWLDCSITDLYPCDCPLCGPEGEGDTCHDGFDNDGDGFTDCAEPFCTISGGFYEYVCDDGVDNDCDGRVDCGDSDCESYFTCIDHSTGCTYSQIQACTQVQGFCYQGTCYTPILIDPLGDGHRLTNAQNGVQFDIGGGQQIQIAWTLPNSDDSWLALDRNGNGRIDNGNELFGNFTAQPSVASPKRVSCAGRL